MPSPSRCPIPTGLRQNLLLSSNVDHWCYKQYLSVYLDDVLPFYRPANIFQILSPTLQRVDIIRRHTELTMDERAEILFGNHSWYPVSSKDCDWRTPEAKSFLRRYMINGWYGHPCMATIDDIHV